MPEPEEERLTARAEFYLCLARAFLPPTTAQLAEGIRRYLAEDLAALSASLRYPVARELAALRAAVRSVPDHLSLLQGYSRLFLVPPVPAPLNVGLYLDGALLGANTLAMEAYYRRHGLACAEDFHDLPDHVSVQLEFLAWLWARAADEATLPCTGAAAAQEFLRRFVLAWLPPFCAAIEAAAKRDTPAELYLWLARLLRTVATHDADAQTVTHLDPHADHRWRHAAARGEPHLRGERKATEAPPPISSEG